MQQLLEPTRGEWSLGDLADVDTTDAQDGDVLVRENGVWVDGQDDNGIAITGGAAATDSTAVTAGDVQLLVSYA